MGKFYGVKVGRNTGVYENWDDCKKEIDGFKGASYKGFKTREEAESFVSGIENKVIEENKDTKTIEMEDGKFYLYTDGSFNRVNPDLCGYGGVIFNGNTMIDNYNGYIREKENSWNITGEIEGVKKGVYRAIKLGIKEIELCYDYEGIEYWLTGEFDCKKKLSKDYREFMLRAMDKIKITFRHTKGHTGILGNEIADLLSKKAINNIKESEEVKLQKLLTIASNKGNEILIDLDEDVKIDSTTIIKALISSLEEKNKIFALEEVKEIIDLDNTSEVLGKLTDILKLNLDDKETALLIIGAIQKLLSI